MSLRMKNKILNKTSIVISIIIISFLHFLGDHSNESIHEFYRLIYIIPIIFAAFQFGFKGGVLTSLIVNLIYSPFLLLWVGGISSESLRELLDIVLFFAIGIIAGILVEKRNISENKLNKELHRYKLLESYTNSIIESIKDGVVAVNNDLLITMMNQGARKIMAIDKETIGQNFTELLSCCMTVKEKVDLVMKKGTPIENFDIKIERSVGQMDIRMNLYPLNSYDTTKGMVIIMYDVTELKKLEKELFRKEKLSAIGELSSGIAHEIRNPLGIIKAIGQTMKKELHDNGELIMELDIIEEEVDRANRVVKALMEFGRPPTGIKNMFPIDDVIEDVLTVANQFIRQHGIKVQFSTAENAEAYIDKELIKQAFINIVFNAVQAMPEGGNLIITVCNVYDVFIKVVFEDTGVGIRKDDMEKIFNPFFTTKSEGTGLGLPIVYKIMEEHSGTISVSSQPGSGTRFEVMLPIRRESNNYENTDS